jgi:hypothetical protein
MGTLNWLLQKVQTPRAGTVPTDLTTLRLRLGTLSFWSLTFFSMRSTSVRASPSSWVRGCSCFFTCAAAGRESESGFTLGSCSNWCGRGNYTLVGCNPLCRSLSLEGLAQNEEVSGGQVPRGYPRQEVPVGPGVVSGMCLTTDIPIRAYQPGNGPVCSRMLTFLAAIGSDTIPTLAPEERKR